MLNSDNFNRNMQNARSEMTNTGRAAQRTAQDMSRIQAASLAVGTAVVAGLGAAAAVSIDFEAQMSRVKGIVGASETEFQKLEEAALDLGASTSKSASEVAIAFEDMAAKGFSATQIIEAMPGVIAAAEASGSDLALTADVVASALNGFGLEAAEASRIADILSKTANISAASMSDMSYAFKYVGPVAHSLGMDIEQVSAAIGIMTNSGLDGSSAGTTLRQALLSLNSPALAQEKLMKQLGFSMRDSSGNAKSLSEIIGGLTEATKGMTEAEKVATIAKLVGAEASSGMISVMSGGVDELDSFTKSLRESAGASKEAAAIMKDNVKASFDEFVGSLESLSIEITSDMLPAFREIIQYGTKIVNSLSEMDGASVKSALTFGGTTAAIALLLSTVGKLSIALRALSASPVGLAISGIAILGGVLAASKVHADNMKTVTLENAEAMTKQADTLKDNIREYDALRDKSKLTTDELGRFVDINAEISKTADPNLIAKLKDEQEKLRIKSGLSNEEFQKMLELNGKIIEVVPESTTKITDQGNAILESTNKAKAFNKEQYEMIRLELEAQKAKAEANMSQYLTTEKALLTDMKNLKKEMNGLDEKEESKRKDIGELQEKLADAERQNNESKIKQLNFKLAVENANLEKIKDQRSEIAQAILDRQKEIDKVQAQIGKLDEVKRKMVDLELKQAGINAKRGEEVKTIETSIVKLEAEKKKLAEITPLAGRNTDEYRNSVAAIDSQIARLQGAKSKVEEIIGKAASMNAELGKAINKNITVNTRNIETTIANTNRGRYGSPRENYHVGGIVGSVPKLHVGGLAAQFAQSPNHNEIDTRLLRNEMVLTEAQQANLMRMIDAGFTQKGESVTFTDPALVAAIKELASRPVSVEIDGREVAEAAYPHIDSKMSNGYQTSLRMNGFKR